jgi:Protein of unknown function (DUF3011)/Amidohydrolase
VALAVLSAQEMSSRIVPDIAACEAATPAGAHLAATTFLLLAVLATPAAAQDTEDDSPIGQSAAASQSVAATVTCSSKPGERSSCAADTSKGVVLLRSTGDAPCLIGRTWGYDQTSVWVSDGCSAEFGAGATVEPDTTKPKPLSHIPNVGFLLVDNPKGQVYFWLFSYGRYLNQRPGRDRGVRVPEDHGHARGPIDAVRHPGDAEPSSCCRRRPRTPRPDCIPLQQQWSHSNSGDFAPIYYLQTDAPLYYYSFTDAYIASAYRALPREAQARLDPMITGFNPADMYGADHIRRVLKTFPGVFTGIGEFSIHKEFVSSKIAGETASLTNPALDRILEFAAETGLVVILHNDIDMPFGKVDTEPVYLTQTKALLARHSKTSIIWAHTGLGRIVRPVQVSAEAAERPPTHLEILAGMLADPGLSHVVFDISWDEVAKYAVATPEITSRVAALFNKYPDRFLFGTDTVAPRLVRSRTTRSSTCGHRSGSS